MYSDPKAVEMYSQKIKRPVALLKESMDKFQPKETMQTDEFKDLDWRQCRRGQAEIPRQAADQGTARRADRRFRRARNRSSARVAAGFPTEVGRCRMNSPQEFRYAQQSDDLGVGLGGVVNRDGRSRRRHAEDRRRSAHDLGKPDDAARPGHLQETRHRAGEFRHQRRRRNAAGGDFRQRRHRHRHGYRRRHARFRQGRAGAGAGAGVHRQQRSVLVREGGFADQVAAGHQPPAKPSPIRPTVRRPTAW